MAAAYTTPYAAELIANAVRAACQSPVAVISPRPCPSPLLRRPHSSPPGRAFLPPMSRVAPSASASRALVRSCDNWRKGGCFSVRNRPFPSAPTRRRREQRGEPPLLPTAPLHDGGPRRLDLRRDPLPRDALPQDGCWRPVHDAPQGKGHPRGHQGRQGYRRYPGHRRRDADDGPRRPRCALRRVLRGGRALR